MPATRERPNPGENDAKRTLEDPFDNRPSLGGGDADSPYVGPEGKKELENITGIKDAEQSASPNNTSDDIGTQESKGSGFNLKSQSASKSSGGSWRNTVGSSGKNSDSYFKKQAKKKGLWLAFALTIATGGTMISVFVSPTTGLVNYKEILVGRFSERMESLVERRTARIMAKKMSQDFTSGS